MKRLLFSVAVLIVAIDTCCAQKGIDGRYINSGSVAPGALKSISGTAGNSTVYYGDGHWGPAGQNLPAANSTTDGYLTHQDWITFNSFASLISGGTTGEYIDGTGHLQSFPSIPAALSFTVPLRNTAGTVAIDANSFDAYGAAAAVTTTSIGAVPTSRTVSTTSPLSGGGALSGNLTLSMIANAYDAYGAAAAITLTGLGAGSAATHAATDFDPAGSAAAVTTTSIGAIPTSQKGAASGVATLNSSSLIPVAQLPVFAASGTGHAAGAVPDPGAVAGSTRFLREDGGFAVPAYPSTFAASAITSGQLALARGGTGADLSSTGGGYLKQATTGATVTVGSIAAGDVPTLNQSTSGSAASNSISGQTGLLSWLGLTSTNRAKTVRDAADTILELGGGTVGTPYKPVGYWDWTGVASAVWPTFNQSTSGNALTATTAANLSGTPALPNGTTATTQAAADNSTKLATTAYADTKLNLSGGTLTGTLTGTNVAMTGQSTFTPDTAAHVPLTVQGVASQSGDLFDLKNSIGTTVGAVNSNGAMTITGSTVSDGPVLSANLLSSSGWTSTGWTGSFGAGWTNGASNTTALTNTLAAVVGNKYQITYTITGNTGGAITIAFGGQSVGPSISGSFGPTATSTATLSITPQSTFNGTLVLSIQSITGVSLPLLSLNSSGGTPELELRENTGLGNTFVGVQSGGYNTTGSSNTANGYKAFYANTTGYNNTANGYQAFYANTTGYNNTANGMWALYANTTGISNTANGYQALYANTTGANNTANGYEALYANTTGISNTANGYKAGMYYGSGSSNLSIVNNSIFLGSNTNALALNDTNETVVGYSALGYGSYTTTLCGPFNANTYVPYGAMNLYGETVNSVSAPILSTVTTHGTAGSTSYYYVVTASCGSGVTPVSNEVSISTSNATLTSSNYNIVTWVNCIGAGSYNVYRGSTTGTEQLIASGINALSYNDTGAAASGAIPTVNTTGYVSAPILIETATHTPSSATDTGTTGQIAWDASYIYVCTATNVWRRAAISSW